jgi:hypothetical protein
MNHEEVREAALRELGDRPGVVGIGLGYKVVGGELTDAVALQIYVEAKKPLTELAPDEVMPAEFRGMSTDVLEPRNYTNAADAQPCADRAQHGTLTGGITISTMVRIGTGPEAGIEAGTLGFMATIPGETPPHNIAAITNRHVVTDGQGALESTMYQPAWKTMPDGTVLTLPTGASSVGDIVKLPPIGNDAQGRFVDAAAIKLSICISSWCHSNCGNSFNKDIQGLALGDPARNDIHDVSTSLDVGNIVYKVGRTTGRTVGRVTKIHASGTFDGVAGNEVIEIDAVSMQGTGNCGGALRFLAKGDSGSALIDANRNLVGLVNAFDPAHPNIATACHIQPVLDALGVVPITELHPVLGNRAAEGMGDETSAVIDAGPDRRAELRGAFYATPRGEELAAEVDRHRLEVVHLVNSVRRVTIAWHRNQGPAFLNRLIANARDPAVPIPHEIAGITRTRLLETMADVLSANGSPELAAAIARRRDEAIARTADIEDLQHLIDDLAGTPVP